MAMIRAGRSMFVFDRELNFFTSSILGGCCGIAAGIAWDCLEAHSVGPFVDIKNMPHVWCFLGDGAEDNGHLYEAVLFVQAHHLPCTFVIEDNGFSVDSSTEVRTGNFRMDWPACVRRLRYVRTYPHAGPGLAERIKFDPAIVAAHARG